MTDETRFHRGMLCGLAELLREFKADGRPFHMAYRAALQADPSPSDDTREALEGVDPVFGVYPWAEAMIVIGMRDLILTLESPTFHTARFLIGARGARHMMTRDIGADAERFRTMAKAFAEGLAG